MTTTQLDELRKQIDRINADLLALLRERARLVLQIDGVKNALGLDGYDPHREEEMLRALLAGDCSPYDPVEVKEIFTTIFRMALDLMEKNRRQTMHVRRPNLVPPEGIRVGNVTIGDGRPTLIAGPCSVESEEQMEQIAAFLKTFPAVRALRGGAYKPRTNPYSFQGLREKGLEILQKTAARHNLATVTEVLDASALDRVAAHADVLQVGARNMYNTELLKALGRVGKPVLLKRGFMATLDEFLLSAEYILAGGNEAVILCERGIRTFERWTRNTLDLSAIPLLKSETSLPVIVDLSHALGRTDILPACGRAALAAGADGLMVEVHPTPAQALSDGFQQLDFAGFTALIAALGL